MNQNKQTIEPLSFAEILALPSTEKEARGLLHTPQEIHQQPSTWLGDFSDFEKPATRFRGIFAKEWFG